MRSAACRICMLLLSLIHRQVFMATAFIHVAPV